MAVLVIETSTPNASLALVSEAGIEQRAFASDRSHNALLFEPLGELLDGRCALDLVLVGSGPGSYSGTRVGIAAAQGVAIAMGCPAVAVPSILAVPAADQGARCLAIGDARRGSYWTARIDCHQLLQDPELCDESEFLQRISASCQMGEKVFSFENPTRLPLTSELADQLRMETPDATRLWKAWQATPQEIRAEWTSQIPQPLYLKPPHITQAKRPWLIPQG